MARTRNPRRLLAVLLTSAPLMFPLPRAAAHGSVNHASLPGPEVAGIERGIDLARACDPAIHELIGEYAMCMNQNQMLLGDDAEAITAFRFMAWLRGDGAQRNGYADAEDFLRAARQAFLQAQNVHPVASARLCRAIGLDCTQLATPVPLP